MYKARPSPTYSAAHLCMSHDKLVPVPGNAANDEQAHNWLSSRAKLERVGVARANTPGT